MKKLSSVITIIIAMTILTGVSSSNDKISDSGYDEFCYNEKISEIRPLDSDIDYLIDENTEIARRGCCSWHGGVCGCDRSSDRIICCDGSLSPSCTCSGY